MRILFAILSLIAALPLAAAELRYNTVVRIASNGETVDFARYEHIRPVLQLTYGGSRTLPANAQVAIDAPSGPIILRPDPLGGIEWPMRHELAEDNPKVTSIPDDLVAAGRVRVAATPSTTFEPSTLAAMTAEYQRFTRSLSFLKRVAAPDPDALLVVAAGPITATSSAGRWHAQDGRLRIPLEDAGRAPLRFSAVPTLVLLDLALE